MVERLKPWQERINRLMTALGLEPLFYSRVRVVAQTKKNRSSERRF